MTRTIVHNPAIVAGWLRPASLRERPQGVRQLRVVTRPATRRRTATGMQRRRCDEPSATQRAAAGPVSEADHVRIPLTKETFGGLLDRWLDHIEARGPGTQDLGREPPHGRET